MSPDVVATARTSGHDREYPVMCAASRLGCAAPDGARAHAKERPAVVDDVQLPVVVLAERNDQCAGLEHFRGPPCAVRCPDPSATVVAVEVDAGERRPARAAVAVAAGDGAAVRVRVLGAREDAARRARRIGRKAMAPLHGRPAEVRAARRRERQRVDLLPRILADVAEEQLAGGAIEAEAPWIAESEGPDLAA